MVRRRRRAGPAGPRHLPHACRLGAGGRRPASSSSAAPPCRPPLVDLRLSEGIDLIAIGHRTEVARAVMSAFDARPVRRELGRITWLPELHLTTGSASAVATTATGYSINVQLLSGDGYPPWPVELAQ